MYQKIVKPLLDYSLSLIGIIITAPLLIIIAVIVGIAHLDNPFFIQPRTGKNKKVFYILKFRSMLNKRDSNGNLLPDKERLSKIGYWLRKTSIDELPQFINVLKGDMSLVGPRPLLTHYAHRYNDFQNRRHEVKPGITGWVQVNGRNSLSWKERFEMDVWYVEHISFATDVKILIKTLKKVIENDGITLEKEIPIEPFEI